MMWKYDVNDLYLLEEKPRNPDDDDYNLILHISQSDGAQNVIVVPRDQV